MTLKNWEIERRAALAKRAQESALERACPACGRRAAMRMRTMRLHTGQVTTTFHECRWCSFRRPISLR